MRALCLLLVLALLASTVSARSLTQKKPEKPVVCPNAPPEMDDNTWPADCKDNALGFACKGVCDLGFTGSPTAVCKKGGWSANGGCKPAKCDGQPPAVANATWASCDDSPVGYVCSATCASPYEQSGPIQSTCTAGTKSASWSTPTEYCGIVRTQALMTFTGTTTGTECSPSATDAVKTSVATYMGSQTGVSQLEVSVVCINPDGSTVTARRLLQSSATVQYLVYVIYIGGNQAATALVDAASADLNQIDNLINNVAAATGGVVTIAQNITSSDVSGDASPQNPQQDATLSLLRSGGDNLQTGVSFALVASYNGPIGTDKANVALTGPTIDPADAVTCSPVAPAPLTNALGLATWNCTTGNTGMSGVTVTVVAPNPAQSNTVTASVSLTIGTDCVGDFGPWSTCSAFCGEGTSSRQYNITVPAANGGRECPFAQDFAETQACNGTTVCAECTQCALDGSQCTELAAGTDCSNQGKCYNGVCQAGNKLYEINSVGPILSASALPTTNSQWFWNRLYRSGFAVGEIVPLAGEDTRTTGYPVTVDPSVSTGAPEDLRTAGSQITTGLRMLNPGANYEDRVEAAVWYLNNTADHPVGLFNGMKFKDMIDNDVKFTFSWYRGDWTGADDGKAPSFRFTLLNPNFLPAAAGGGSKSRIEFYFDPIYDAQAAGVAVKKNTWVTETISFNQGKLGVYMGGYALSYWGDRFINCWNPISWWMNPASQCANGGKAFPWFDAGVQTSLYGTDDIFRDGIIWEMRVAALNPTTLAYANNVKVSTSNGYNYTYVFTA